MTPYAQYGYDRAPSMGMTVKKRITIYDYQTITRRVQGFQIVHHRYPRNHRTLNVLYYCIKIQFVLLPFIGNESSFEL